ncbi:MAG: hypothetical protein Kow0022_01060 [Phycisphaerales bacterium]
MTQRAWIRGLLAGVLLAARALAQPGASLVHVSLSVDDGSAIRHRQAAFTLRLCDELVRLDLGPVCVLGERSRGRATLTAWHQHDPTTVFVDEAEHLATLLRRDLPPMWCGVLADWIARSPDAYPLVGRDWPQPPRAEPLDPGRVRLRTETLVYERIVEPGSGVVRSESIQLQRGAVREELLIEYTPIEPGDPSTWGVDGTSRRAVSSISALRAQPARITSGQSVAALRLFEPSGLITDTSRAFVSEPSALAERHAAALVLGFYVVGPRDGHTQEVLSPGDRVQILNDVRTRASALAVERGLPFPVFIARPVIIFDVPDFARGQLEEAVAASEALVTDPLLPQVEASIPRALWSQPPRETIDLLTPGAQNAIVVIDPARRLVIAARLDDDRAEAVESAARAVVGAENDELAPGGE